MLEHRFKNLTLTAEQGVKIKIMNANLVQRFHNVTISNEKTKFLLGKCLKKAFDEIKSDALEAENILALAWKFQVPQFDQMLQDHEDFDYLPFP